MNAANWGQLIKNISITLAFYFTFLKTFHLFLDLLITATRFSKFQITFLLKLKKEADITRKEKSSTNDKNNKNKIAFPNTTNY